MKKMRYQLLAESTNIKLTKDVNKLLNDGWEPWGHPFINEGLFFQAVLYIPQKEDTDGKGKKGKGNCVDDK